MATKPQQNVYNATIGDKEIKVDIYDLPYSEFSADNPLIINGKVVISGKVKNIDLSNVQIIGELDISKLKNSIVLPKISQGKFICRNNSLLQNITASFANGITEIDCTGSVPSLSFLNGRLPGTVKQVIVSDNLLDNLFGNIKLLAEAKLLQQRYPGVSVVGDKTQKTLEQALEIKPTKIEINPEYLRNPLSVLEIRLPEINTEEKIEETKTDIVEEQPETTENKVPEPVTKNGFPIKTEKFYDINEILTICLEDPEIQAFGLETSALKSEIFNHMSSFRREFCFNPETNSTEFCITRSRLQGLVAKLKTTLQKNKEKELRAQRKAERKAKREQEKMAKQQEEKQQQVAKQTVVTEEKPKTTVQTEEYANIREIMEICMKDEYIISLNLTDVALSKILRKHMTTKLLNQNTRSTTYCVLRSKIPELIEKVKAELQKTESKKAAALNQPTNTTEQVSGKRANKKTLAASEEVSLAPIKIKKYIPENLWKAIRKVCGKHVALLKNVLNNIASVNTTINETPSSANLQIIDPKTHKRTSSSYMKREDNNAIVQSISNSLRKDNKRIVWSYIEAENIIVCTGVFPEHTKPKSANQYAKTRDFASDRKDAKGRDITLQMVIDEGYLDVDDLLTLFDELENAPYESKEIRSGKKPVAKPDIVPVLEEDIQVQNIIKIETPHNLTEVKAAQAQVEAVIKIITDSINQDLIAITKEDDIAKQIEQVDLIREALVEKARIMSVLSEFGKTEDILKKFQIFAKSREK